MKKEALLYLIFGGLTTVLNIITYYLFVSVGVDYKIATTVAWFVSVLFAFFTNKSYVFKSSRSIYREIGPFFGARILSYLMDLGMMVLLIDVAQQDDMLAKIVTNVLVVVFNYVASKMVIFNDGHQS